MYRRMLAICINSKIQKHHLEKNCFWRNLLKFTSAFMTMKDGLISASRSFSVNYLFLFHCEWYWHMKNDSNSVSLSGLEGSLDIEL